MSLRDRGCVSLYMQMSNLCWDKGKIPRHIRTFSPLSKLLDTPNIKKQGRSILKLKQHSENKLQNANHNHYNIHHHVMNKRFQGQEGIMSVDTLAPLGLSLAKAENQRRTKHPRMSDLKVTCCVEVIKKIREHELHHLEAMVWVSFTSRP